MRKLNSLISLIFVSFATLTTVGCATSGDFDDEYADAQSDATSPGKVDLAQSADGQWRFKVISGNGRTLLSSEAYTSRTGALNGVLSVLDNGVDPAMYQVNPTASGGFSLRLRAANYEVIAFAQTYSTKSSATRAIGSCVRAIETYLDKVEGATGARVAVFQGPNGFHFNLHASNGAVILSSETYSTAAAAWNGAFAVQDAAQLADAFTVKTSTDGRYFFTLTAENGQVVGVSQLYTARESALAGIESVKSTLAKLDLI